MSEISKLREKAATLRAKAAELDKLADTVESALAGESAPKRESVILRRLPEAPKAVKVLRKPGTVVLASKFRRIQDLGNKMVQERGAPVPFKDIYQEVERLGLVPDGNDPRSAVSAYLSRSGTLKSIQGHGWWWKDKPLPKKHEGPGAGAPDPSE
jgi:hypothetical protein